ncbi:MAG: hypothetical protein NTAFB05_25530 [Nitrobacter sp.]|uniref:hypothetical protein n=1 Tax=Nitrobacter sp. TaxID=29420 RepID=UPI00387DFFC0
MVNIPHPRVAFGDLPDQFKTDADEVKLPRKILARLLDLYISSWDFDEDWYLTTYPDIAAAVSSNGFPSGWAHFRAVGYLEGRLGSRPIVDSEWYIETYPDVAEAMLDGKVASAAEHFENFGYAEGRLPSKPGVDAQWYARRYMRARQSVEEKQAHDDFVRRGYRELALPAPPR